MNAFGVATTKAITLATAYQASNPAKPALVTVTLQAQSSVSLSGAVNNEAQIVVGPTNAVAGGTGVVVATFKNNLGGTIVVGLNLTSQQANTYTLVLPAGYWWAVRQTSGTGLQVVSAFDQVVG